MKYIILLIRRVFLFGFQYSDTNKSDVRALNNRFDLLLSSGNKYIELNEVTDELKNILPSTSIHLHKICKCIVIYLFSVLFFYHVVSDSKQNLKLLKIMEQANWLIIPIAAFFPLILGSIWYHPKVLGTRLAQINGEPLIQNKSFGKMLLIYLLSILLAYVLTLMSVHQSAIFQLFFMDPELANANSEFNTFINEFMETYGNRHRSFGHGMIHGAEAGLFFGLALLGITTLLQNKPFKLIWIHLFFWVICCSLMAGLVCTYF